MDEAEKEPSEVREGVDDNLNGSKAVEPAKDIHSRMAPSAQSPEKSDYQAEILA